VAIRAKHFEYWVSLGDDGEVSADGEPVPLGEDVSAEHLLLAGLARCSIQSLAYFARQRNIELKASAYASGTVTRRDDDDRYGFTDIECRMDVDFDGKLADDDLRSLLESAEWGCFVGASLNPAPRYAWRVNGRDL
jgi:organic hydroperoxide reductase OsmC/OhrA